MPKTEYTIDDGGLRMKLDVSYNLDDAGNFDELGQVVCTNMAIRPFQRWLKIGLADYYGAQTDTEVMAVAYFSREIIEQIEGELLAAKRADAERREEGDR